jgi:hypothetical protein
VQETILEILRAARHRVTELRKRHRIEDLQDPIQRKLLATVIELCVREQIDGTGNQPASFIYVSPCENEPGRWFVYISGITAYFEIGEFMEV